MPITNNKSNSIQDIISQLIGEKGMQGTSGLQGLQGLMGRRGLQGLQGTVGCQGLRGLQGCPGLQGPKGLQGPQGLQGYRGGTGLQGARGCQGLQGARGLIGVQGVQGPKGRKGPKGYIGYQGDDGEAGIQGLQGDVGAIWFDGIRLNGYNTKLFVYDSDLGYFVSTNDTNPYNYLRIRNGAVIKLVTDEGCLSTLSAGSIPVRSLEGTQYNLTNYPAYYSENVSISTVISSRIPNRTVMEFTFYDGGWYYSGGSLVSSSSSNAVIESNIKVRGVTVGNILNGETIWAGTTMQEIFEHMLIKVIPPKATAPRAVALSPHGSNIPSPTVEVGTTVSFTMSTRYVDGYYSSSDTSLYPASEFDENNGCTGGTLPANCGLVSRNYYRDNAAVNASVYYESVPEGDYDYKCSVTYMGSEVVPKDSGNEDDASVVIPAGTSPKVDNFKFYARFKVFRGNTPADPYNLYGDRFTTQAQLQTLEYGWLPTSGSSSPTAMDSVDGNTAFVLAIPSAYGITATSTVNGIPVNVDEKWVYRHSVQYTVGNVETVYKVYVMHALIPQTYTNIIITKQS